MMASKWLIRNYDEMFFQYHPEFGRDRKSGRSARTGNKPGSVLIGH